MFYNSGDVNYAMYCGRDEDGEDVPLMGLTCAQDNTYIASISPQQGFQFDVDATKVSYDFTLAPNDETTSLWSTYDGLAFTFDREIVSHLVDRILRHRNGVIFWRIGPWEDSGPYKSIRFGVDGRLAVDRWLQLCSGPN